MKIKYKFAIIAASMSVLVGCASVKVYRLDVNPANGKETVDTSVEGIPYYMPRPYLEVYEPFVVDTHPYFVTAQLTPDGKYLRLTSLPADLNDPNLSKLIATSEAAPDINLEGRKMGSTADGQNSAQSTTDTNASPEKENSGGNSPTNSPAGSSTNATPSEAGKSSVKVTSTSDFYITPGRRFFDIVYLPDYSDKRIIQIHGGLGQANLSVTLAQGWSLAALNATVDNTELAKELFKTWDTALQLAQKAATMTFPPASMLQGAAVVSGTQITCKLIDSTMVAPGLYPLPKDVEYPQAYGSSRPNVSFVDHMGLTTYHVYTVQALTPIGDSPLNFTLYGSEQNASGGPSGGTSSGPPQNNSTAPDYDKLSKALMAQLASNTGFAPYSGLVTNVTAVTGTNVNLIVFTLHLKSAPADQATSDKISAAALPVAQSVVKSTPPGNATVQPPIEIEPKP